MSEPVLRIRDLWRTYQTGRGPLNVLRGVDLDVAAGEIIGLIGPSGSGKSSLLHAAGLLEHPSQGSIAIQGRECGGLPDRERTLIRLHQIGFVYQFHHLLAECSALENVALPAMIAGTASGAARAGASQILARLGLADRLDHLPAQLSGGEQQRVALARAMINRPALLLADEPTGNLDPEASTVVFKLLTGLAREAGLAVLVATHNVEMTRFMDRVLKVRDGRLAAADPA